MASKSQAPPATKARVVLEPLKIQDKDSQSPELKKRKRAEDENKEIKEHPETETTRTVPDLREQAGDIEKNVLAFCLDPSKKVNKEQTATIMRYFADMRGIVEELLLHNSYLTGKLEQSAGHGNKETQILTAVNKTLQTSKRLETAVKKTAKAEPKQPSYAEKVKMTSNKVGQIAVKPPKKCGNHPPRDTGERNKNQ
jgi:hypothetical protein